MKANRRVENEISTEVHLQLSTLWSTESSFKRSLRFPCRKHTCYLQLLSLQTIQRTSRPDAFTLRQMQIDLRRLQTLVAQQLLHSSDVGTVLQQVRRKAMTQ